MKSNAFWLVIVLLVIFSVITFLFGYWMVGIGFAIVIVALVISRLTQRRNPKPTE